jgi:DNA-binding transcriptional MerR regulator
MSSSQPQIPDKLYFRIGEVAEIIGVEPYVLRYWESEFPNIAPSKSRSKQRLYRRQDVETIMTIRDLLYKQRYTISGARKRIKDLTRVHRGNTDEHAQIGLELPPTTVDDDVKNTLAVAEIAAIVAEMQSYLETD